MPYKETGKGKENRSEEAENTEPDTAFGISFIGHDTNGLPVEASCLAYEELTNETAAWPESTKEWYVVTGDDVVIKKRVTVSGTVNLILCDGADTLDLPPC